MIMFLTTIQPFYQTFRLLIEGKNSGELRGMTGNIYIKTFVIQQMWSRYVDFEGCVNREYWIDSGLYLPVFSIMYDTKNIWYDVNQDMTYACILIKVRGRKWDKIVLSKRYVSPMEFCKDSLWEKRVVILYCLSHYQNFREHKITNN